MWALTTKHPGWAHTGEPLPLVLSSLLWPFSCHSIPSSSPCPPSTSMFPLYDLCIWCFLCQQHSLHIVSLGLHFIYYCLNVNSSEKPWKVPHTTITFFTINLFYFLLSNTYYMINTDIMLYFLTFFSRTNRIFPLKHKDIACSILIFKILKMSYIGSQMFDKMN